MGMDVFGKNPTSEVGKYFRRNVWHWRRLADLVCRVRTGAHFEVQALAVERRRWARRA